MKYNLLEPELENKIIKQTKKAACPDQVKYRISNGEPHQFKDEEIKNVDYENVMFKRGIVIVLESPHKEEYKDSNKIGPAKGVTGKKITKYLKKVLKSSKDVWYLVKKSDFEIIIANAVQFQCSKGKDLRGKNNRDNSKNRDYRFIKYLLEGCGKDLRERIRLLEPVLVINACPTSNCFNALVEWYLQRQCRDIGAVYAAVNHPITWNNTTRLFRTKAVKK